MAGGDNPYGPETKSFTVTDTISSPTGTIVATVGGGADVAGFLDPANGIQINQRERGGPGNSGSFTYSDLFRDRFVVNAAGATGLYLSLEGLAANTTFTIQLWAYEHNNIGSSKNVEFFNATSGTEVSIGGFTTTANTAPVSNDSYSITANVTSDASGRLILKSVSNFDGQGIFNGFVLTAIPEPTSSSLMLGGLALIGFRRRVNR